MIRERGRGLVIQDVPKTTAGLTQDVYVGRGTASPRTAAVIRRAL
ncbi:hypothetical protein [Geodermatophilus saharensis]|nr:hypothetical protein [Geodermatophilus saharensis]